MGVATSGSAIANTISGVSVTGDMTGCWADELKALIEECIQANRDDPPEGNPGPFTQGYNSIVVLTGQCYGGGLSELTGIGDDVIVGAAAASDQQSGWRQSTQAVDSARYFWLTKLTEEITSNPNRGIKDILDAVRMANPDPSAMTPAPSTSSGGDGVTLGNPANGDTKSYHAVLFGGVEDDEVNDPELAPGQNAATRKALDDMESALKASGNVPAENIKKMFPGTCEELRMMITDTWKKMNDNEQFILVLANHGSLLTIGKEPIEDDEETGGQKASFETPEHFDSENIREPEVILDAKFVFESGPVILNDEVIGTLSPTTGMTRQRFPISPGLLNPVGNTSPPNLLLVPIPRSVAPLTRVALSTGPVASGVILLDGVPTVSEWGLVVLMLITVAAGSILLRCRSIGSQPSA